MLTDRQKHLLGNLNLITSRLKRSGKRDFYLVGHDVSVTITSLLVKRMIAVTSNGEGLELIQVIERSRPEPREPVRAQHTPQLVL